MPPERSAKSKSVQISGSLTDSANSQEQKEKQKTKKKTWQQWLAGAYNLIAFAFAAAAGNQNHVTIAVWLKLKLQRASNLQRATRWRIFTPIKRASS